MSEEYAPGRYRVKIVLRWPNGFDRQRLLDELTRTRPADRPVMVPTRDVSWSTRSLAWSHELWAPTAAHAAGRAVTRLGQRLEVIAGHPVAWPTVIGIRVSNEYVPPATPNLDRFIAVGGADEDRMALGLETLESAWREAGDAGLVGWQVTINEYVVAARDGKPLNRPLGEPR